VIPDPTPVDGCRHRDGQAPAPDFGKEGDERVSDDRLSLRLADGPPRPVAAIAGVEVDRQYPVESGSLDQCRIGTADVGAERHQRHLRRSSDGDFSHGCGTRARPRPAGRTTRASLSHQGKTCECEVGSHFGWSAQRVEGVGPFDLKFQIRLMLKHFMIKRSNRHLSDDIVCLCLIAAVDDVPPRFVVEHRVGGRRTILRALQFARIDDGAIKVDQSLLDFCHMLPNSPLQDVGGIGCGRRFKFGIACETM
jgi:hypothetical protein